VAYVKKDLKSPRDLAVYLKSRGLTVATAKKDHVEAARNEARNYDGPSSVFPNGQWNEVGTEEFLGVLRNY